MVLGLEVGRWLRTHSHEHRSGFLQTNMHIQSQTSIIIWHTTHFNCRYIDRITTFHISTKKKLIQAKSVLTCAHVGASTHCNYPSLPYLFSYKLHHCYCSHRNNIKFDYFQYAPVHLSLLFIHSSHNSYLCLCVSEIHVLLILLSIFLQRKKSV